MRLRSYSGVHFLPAEDISKTRRQCRDTVLVVDAAQKVPDSVLKVIIDEWFVPYFVE
jgi:hypothetical protein